MTDQKDIWTAFRSGDEEAFSRLFFDHYSRLFYYGVKLVRDEELVKDVIQDFYLYLFEHREGLTEEVENVNYYLLSSFRRRLLRAIDRDRREKDRQDSKMSGEDQLFTITAEDILIREESKEQHKRFIVRLLEELPPRQREILYLKYYLDFSLPEIAETLSISYQVAANHLYRALKKLKENNGVQKSTRRNLWFLFLW
jgi:RNA polymerase sigma factor (sigma-70 family)